MDLKNDNEKGAGGTLQVEYEIFAKHRETQNSSPFLSRRSSLPRLRANLHKLRAALWRSTKIVIMPTPPNYAAEYTKPPRPDLHFGQIVLAANSSRPSLRAVFAGLESHS